MIRLFAFLAPVALIAADGSFDARKAAVRALLSQCDYAGALAQAAAINREWPDDLEGYQLLTEAHLGLGHYQDAEKSLQWMLDLRIGKADAAGWLLVSRFREAIGDLDGATDAVNTGYSRIAPGQEKLRTAMLVFSGHIQYVAGKLESAERVLQQAIGIAPEDRPTLEELARVRIAQGKRAEAVEIFHHLAESTGHPRFLFEAGEYARFEKAARARMESTDNANRELALFYAGEGKRPVEALAIARREAKRREDVPTLDALAVALQANGEKDEARKVMKRVLAIGTLNPEILRHAADMGVKPE